MLLLLQCFSAEFLWGPQPLNHQHFSLSAHYAAAYKTERALQSPESKLAFRCQLAWHARPTKTCGDEGGFPQVQIPKQESGAFHKVSCTNQTVEFLTGGKKLLEY